MAEPDDPISQARQGGIWLVGLSGAAIGGALAKLDWLIRFPPWAKVAFAIAFILFLASLYYGISYVAQLLVVKQLQQKKKNAEDTQKPQVDIDKIGLDLDTANGRVARFHYQTFVPFLLGCAAVVVCLNLLLWEHWEIERPPEPPVPPNKYLITNVPVHSRGIIIHSHTLLLNQQTGEVWELTCQNGKIVEFRSVAGGPK